MEKNNSIKIFISVFFNVVVGMFALTFATLFLGTFKSGLIFEKSSLIRVILISFITLITVLDVISLTFSNSIVNRVLLTLLFLICFFSVLLFILKKTGFFDKIDSVEDLRIYVSSFGSFTTVIYVLLQFLQVVVLPLPSVIILGAGVLIFGPLKAAILSSIGIISGSIVAFFLGRIFGYKVVKWIVGKENLDKGLKAIKGKDKIVLSFMFLFPFFPDDILCFVSGITTVDPLYFLVMIIITRLISIFTSACSLNNSFIPYTTWWGILIWVVLFAITVFLAIFIYKKGDKIESFFSKKKKLKNNTYKNN